MRKIENRSIENVNGGWGISDYGLYLLNSEEVEDLENAGFEVASSLPGWEENGMYCSGEGTRLNYCVNKNNVPANPEQVRRVLGPIGVIYDEPECPGAPEPNYWVWPR